MAFFNIYHGKLCAQEKYEYEQHNTNLTKGFVMVDNASRDCREILIIIQACRDPMTTAIKCLCAYFAFVMYCGKYITSRLIIR